MRRLVPKITVIYALLLALLPTTSAPAFAQDEVATAEATEVVETVSVETPLGEIVGQQTARIRTFLGIPYAEAPVDELRWRSPRPLAAWDSRLQAKEFGSACPQDLGSIAGLSDGDTSGSEDCLFLNIYTPPDVDSGANLPVMVWIHGGAFVAGASNQYDLSVLAAENNLVAVSLNYRLGALGFLAHPALSASDESGESGNYALLDQLLALQWVQDNIAVFGGDPDNVTIFGESAGGSSVCYLLASPLAAGLFHKAILQSAVCLYPPSYVTLAEAEQTGIEYAEAVGCADDENAAACLRDVPVDVLMSTPSRSVGISGSGQWGVVTGHHALPFSLPQAFASGSFNRVPIINGTNRDEGTLFDVVLPVLSRKPVTAEALQERLGESLGEVAPSILAQYPLEDYASVGMAAAAVTTDSVFACPAYALDTIIAGQTPTWAYEFDDPDAPLSLFGLLRFVLRPLNPGAYHAAEIPYILRAPLIGDPADFTPAQDALSRAMMQYWVNFARTGDPNDDDLPRWQPFADDGVVLVLAPDNIHPTHDFAIEHQCDFWAALWGDAE